jgi:hypothetical protein
MEEEKKKMSFKRNKLQKNGQKLFIAILLQISDDQSAKKYCIKSHKNHPMTVSFGSKSDTLT